MATVRFYLDKRTTKKDGTHPLRLMVSHKNKQILLNLGISISPENWAGDKITGGVKDRRRNNEYIHSRLAGIQSLLFDLKAQGKLSVMSAGQLKWKLEHPDSPDTLAEEKIKGERYLFREHAEKFIASREAEGTRATYRYTLDTLARHFDLDTLTFGDIDYNWLEDLDIRLRPTCRVNTRSIHFRSIRAIYKNATRRKLVSKDLYPFDEFTIKSEKTLHRTLTADDLRTLRDYPVEPHQERYRDLFMLQFYLIGINTADLLRLPADHLHNGRITFRRAKTRRIYDILVPDEALALIRKYSPGKKGLLLNFLDEYDNYKDFLSRYNRNLKEIGPVEWGNTRSPNGRPVRKKARTPLFPFLTGYYTRHTWATLAAALDIPKETIAAALGHGGNSVTDIYIRFDNRKVDAANRRVIDFVNSSATID